MEINYITHKGLLALIYNNCALKMCKMKAILSGLRDSIASERKVITYNTVTGSNTLLIIINKNKSSYYLN